MVRTPTKARTPTKVHIYAKDLEVLPDPQDCLDKLVEKFVSGDAFDEQTRALYLKGVEKVTDPAIKIKLNQTYQTIINAYNQREGVRDGAIPEYQLRPLREAILAMYEELQTRKRLQSKAEGRFPPSF